MSKGLLSCDGFQDTLNLSPTRCYVMNKRLLEHFYQLGLIDQAQAHSSVMRHQHSGGDLFEKFLELEILSEKDAARGFASFYRYPLIDLNEHSPDKDALKSIDGGFAVQHQLLPLNINLVTRKIIIAIFDPAKCFDALDFIQRRTGFEALPQVVERTALSQAIDYFYFGKVPVASADVGLKSGAVPRVPPKSRPLKKAVGPTPNSGPLVFGGAGFAKELRSGMISLPEEIPPVVPKSRSARRFGRRAEAKSGGFAPVPRAAELEPVNVDLLSIPKRDTLPELPASTGGLTVEGEGLTPLGSFGPSTSGGIESSSVQSVLSPE